MRLIHSKRFLAAVAVLTGFVLQAAATDCDEGSNNYGNLNLRVLLIRYDGIESAAEVNRTHHEQVYGSCKNIDDHIEQVTSFFESYGFDMSSVKAAPFQKHITDDFEFACYGNSPGSNHKLLLTSFYEYVEFANTPVIFGSFGLVAKRDIEGPKGKIDAGTFFLTGVTRVIVDGRAQCVDYRSRLEKSWLGASDKYTSYILEVYNEDWGHGGFSGLLVREEGRPDDDKAIITFPGNKW